MDAEHLELQIDRFASRDASFDRGISAKRLERYGRIESDVLKWVWTCVEDAQELN